MKFKVILKKFYLKNPRLFNNLPETFKTLKNMQKAEEELSDSFFINL